MGSSTLVTESSDALEHAHTTMSLCHIRRTCSLFSAHLVSFFFSLYQRLNKMAYAHSITKRVGIGEIASKM